MMRIDAVQAAKRYKYLMMNAPGSGPARHPSGRARTEGADDRAAGRPRLGRGPHRRRRGSVLGVDRALARGRRHRDPRFLAGEASPLKRRRQQTARRRVNRLLQGHRVDTVARHAARLRVVAATSAIIRTPSAVRELADLPTCRPCGRLVKAEDISCLRASRPGPRSIPRSSSGRRSIIFRSTPAKSRRWKHRRASDSSRLERVAVRAFAEGTGGPCRGGRAQSLSRVRRLGAARGARRYAGVPADRIVAGAGLDNVLETLMLLLIEPGDRVIISEPTFMVYRVARPRPRRRDRQRPAGSGFPLDARGHPGCGRRPHQADHDLQSEQPDRQPVCARGHRAHRAPRRPAWSRSTRRTPSSPARATAT